LIPTDDKKETGGIRLKKPATPPGIIQS